MANKRQIINICSFCICTIGTIILVWAYITQPGLYSGMLRGHFYIYPPDNSGEYFDHTVDFKAESLPVWSWNKPKSFTYDSINITINDNRDLTVFFPSLRYTDKDGEGEFSKSFLNDTLTSTSETEQATILPEQLDELYSFILSAGDGTLPRPCHHTYDLEYLDESPYDGSFTHWRLRRSYSLILVGIFILAAGIALRFFGTSGGFTIVSGIVLANYGFFFLGIYLNSYGGGIDEVGAFLYKTSYVIGILLVPSSVFYSFMRRFNPKIQKWDFFGVSLSIFLFLIAMLFIDK